MGQSAEFVKRIKKYSYVGNFCNLGFAMVYTNKRGYNFIDKEGNELKEVSKVQEKTVSPGKDEIKIDGISINGKDRLYKIFLWDSITGMNPVSPCCLIQK